MFEGFEIKSYSIDYPAFWKKGLVPTINLYDKNSVNVGGIAFTDGATPAKTVKKSGYVALTFKLRDYPYVMDILRNEMPVGIMYDKTSGQASLRTDKELVGDGDKA